MVKKKNNINNNCIKKGFKQLFFFSFLFTKQKFHVCISSIYTIKIPKMLILTLVTALVHDILIEFTCVSKSCDKINQHKNLWFSIMRLKLFVVVICFTFFFFFGPHKTKFQTEFLIVIKKIEILFKLH